MAIKLISNTSSEFMQNIIEQMIVTLTDIEASPTIEVIFDDESEYERFHFQNDELHFKNILPDLIDL